MIELPPADEMVVLWLEPALRLLGESEFLVPYTERKAVMFGPLGDDGWVYVNLAPVEFPAPPDERPASVPVPLRVFLGEGPRALQIARVDLELPPTSSRDRIHFAPGQITVRSSIT
jgi:hypothetical protein